MLCNLARHVSPTTLIPRYNGKRPTLVLLNAVRAGQIIVEGTARRPSGSQLVRSTSSQRPLGTPRFGGDPGEQDGEKGSASERHRKLRQDFEALADGITLCCPTLYFLTYVSLFHFFMQSSVNTT